MSFSFCTITIYSHCGKIQANGIDTAVAMQLQTLVKMLYCGRKPQFKIMLYKINKNHKKNFHNLGTKIIGHGLLITRNIQNCSHIS